MNLYHIILAVIVVLTLINLATLTWVNALQKRLRGHDKVVDNTTTQIQELKQEAHNVALAESLLELEQTAGTDVQNALEQASSIFSRDLAETTLKITQKMETSADQLVKAELEKYQETIGNLRAAASASLGQINDEIEKQRQTLTANLESEIKAEKQRLIDKFEAKVADVVSAYLVESMGSDVDLGAQSQYLFRMLDEHKAELKQILTSET